MTWLSFFEWFCLLCGVLSVVCIVVGYPAWGGIGVLTFATLGLADHRSRRDPPKLGGDGAGDRVPVGPAPPTSSTSSAAQVIDDRT